MRRTKSLIKMLVMLALVVCTLALTGAALAEGISVIEYTLYEDGSRVTNSYSLESGDGYVLNDYMALKPWTYVLDPSNGPDDMTENEIIVAWETGMREWNRYLASRMYTMNNTTGSVKLDLEKEKGTYDKKNTMSFAKLESGVLAVTKAYRLSEKLPEGYPAHWQVVEADIIFNTAVDWTDVAKGGRGYDLCSIATHELGHTLGMADVKDSSYSYVTMYGYGMMNDVSPRSLSKPDLVGLSQYYDVPGIGGPGPLPTPTPTPDPSEGLTAEINTSTGGLNMRAEPSVNGAWVTTIPRGATVNVLEKGDEWSKVKYNDYTGYVKNQYLVFKDPGATPTPAPETRDAVVNASPRLNMRKSPSTGSTVLTQVPTGAIVKVIDYGAEWSKIIYNGYTGYVASQYITLTGDAPGPGETDTPNPGETDTPGPGETETPAPITGEAIVTSSTRLNMRKSPSTGSAILVKIPAGATVKVLSYASDWSRISYNGQTGYVVSQYISMKETETERPQQTETNKPQETETNRPQETETSRPQETETAAPEQSDAVYRTVTISGPATKLNMRAGAGQGYDVVGQVTEGTKVEVLATEGSWSRIKTNGLTGYVMSTYLK